MSQRSSRRHLVPKKVDDVIVHELVTLIQKCGAKILRNETKLVLTLPILNHLNRRLVSETELLTDTSSVDDIVPLSPADGDVWLGLECRNTEDELFLLRDFLRRLSIVKVTQGSGTVQGSVDISLMEGLTVLELRRVPIHLIVGLQSLRPHMRMMICSRCLHSLEDLFAGCGGDRCSPFAWTELLSVSITDNAIEAIDNSMRLLPSLVSLDLSHNQISDTRGLEYLTELQYLNLSYNRLQRLPVLGSRARLRLRVISVRNNRLETLEGLESFVNLQQADVAFNCLLHHCVLSPFLGLPHVVMICLEGNPISFHGRHRIVSAEHLHPKSLQANCVIDGKHLTTTECSFVDVHGSSCRTQRHAEAYKNISIGTFPTDGQELESVDNREMAGPSTDSAVIDYSLSDPPARSKRRPKRPPLIREVSIAEDANRENRREASPPLLEIQSGFESDPSALTVQDEMEQFRKRYGKEWLIVGSKLNVLAPVALDPVETTAIAMTSSEADYDDDDEKRHRQSQISDDVIVLGTETEPPSSREHHATGTDAVSPDRRPEPSESGDNRREVPWQKQVSLDEDSSEDDDDDDAVLPPFIVQMEKPGVDASTTILVVVSDRDLREKNVLTGRTMERLDLRSVCSVDSLSPAVATNKLAAVDGECPRIRIGFTYVRRDRRERIYTMEDVDSHRQFLALLKPLVDAKTLEEVTFGALQCLKCSAQFSKDVATRVVRKSRRPPNDGLPLPACIEAAKGYVTEVSACPNCTSDMVVELHDGPTACLDGPGSKPGTIPGSPQRYMNDWSSVGSLPQSASHLSDDVKRSIRSSSCCTVQVEVEVHAHSLPVALRRSGSDITILSNPSQSSIMVMPSSEYAINMDTVSENVATLLPEPDRNCASAAAATAAASNFELDHRGCTSSDSGSSSACTALETSIYNSNTAQTPDSFVSRLSDKVTSSSYGNSTSDLRRPLLHPVTENSVRLVAENQAWSPPSSPLSPSIAVHSSPSASCSSNGSRPITWSCRCAEVEYSFVDFGHVDHRLQLYLDLEVLAETEELVALLRANIVPYVKNREFPGLLVISKSRVHILRITKKETDQPQDWLQPYESKPLAMLMHLNIRLGNQAFQLEFGPQATATCFTFLLRDADHCNSFVAYFLDKLGSQLRSSDGGPFQCGLDGDETLQTLREHLLPWKPEGQASNDNDDVDNEVPIVLYLMCYWKPPESDGFEPVSLATTSTDVYVFSEDLHWPVPHLILPPNEVLSRQQLTPIQRRAIQDLTSLEQMDPSGLQLTLTFLDENTREECSLHIATETEASLLAIVGALKEPWEKLFGLELQVIAAKQVTT